MTRRRRVLLAGAAGLLAATPACAGTRPLARPLTIGPSADDGAMRPLGGLVLDDDAIGFGGLSALHLGADGRITAVSDLAQWLTARLVLRDGRPQGLAELRTGPLRDGAGQPLARGTSGDAESLARLPDGSWLVGFERWHRIRAYPTLDAPGRYVEAPPGLELAPANMGLESLAVLADGRWLALAEGLAPADSPDLVRGWLGIPGAWRSCAYRPAPGFRPADASPLPDGGALVLERSFSLLGGFGSRVVRLPASSLTGAVLEGEELLRLAPPLPIDNFEGISVARNGERTLVALISDDNQNLLQRTLLLLFDLAGA